MGQRSVVQRVFVVKQVKSIFRFAMSMCFESSFIIFVRRKNRDRFHLPTPRCADPSEHSISQLFILASQICDLSRLTILAAAKFDNGSQSGGLTKMSLSSDIARGNMARLAGRKGSANLPVRLVPGGRASRSDNGPIYKTAPGDSSPSPGA